MNDIQKQLGFHWNRDVVPQEAPAYSVDRACFRFKKMLAEYVWDAGVLEDNPFTFPEVQTLLDGVTVGGHKISDQEQILNLAESAKALVHLVRSSEFALNKTIFTQLHGLVARNEALEWGVFRGEGKETNYTPAVALGGHGRYHPLPTMAGAPLLNQHFEDAVTRLEQYPVFERALAFSMYGALQQFFFDGNKRTSRLMMNGLLMSHGIDAISIPAASAKDFNEKMVQFYLNKDATDMMLFLCECHPEPEHILDQPAPSAEP